MLKAPLQLVYQAYWGLIVCWRAALSFFCTNPLFQSRCASFGSNVSVGNLPYIAGPVQVHIGNHCWIGGELAVFSGHTLPNPQFIMQDHAEIGWNVRIVVNEQVLLEEHRRVSNDCRISDSDGHPRQADLRAQGLPMDRKDIRPVRIGKHAWIGNGTHIMKGVTIGEGAVIGANSVVISDIPPYCLALGNPAEVLFRNYGKPSRATRTSGSPAGPGPGA